MRLQTEGMFSIGFTAEYRYFCKDHLGSVRKVLSYDDDWSGAYTEYQSNKYLPFGGLEFEDNLAENKKLFTGKELQDSRVGNDILRLYDFGARYYDPTVARWTSIDPLAEKYYSHSPYNYVGNNPISRIDPDGRDWYRSKDGSSTIWIDDDTHMIVRDDVEYINIGRSFSIYMGDGVWLSLYQNRPVFYGGYVKDIEGRIMDQAYLLGSLLNDNNYVLSDLSKYNLYMEAQRRGSAEAAKTIFGDIIAPIVGTGLIAGGLASLPSSSNSFIQMLSKSRIPDWIRYGRTVVPNQLIYGSGAMGATVVNAIKGGGKLASTGQSMGFHYHIHKFNWFKPWEWFRQTPIIKP